ncbi:hypothetical protein BaRGS_00025261 [Batillaria attramentaria]|uniref:Coiled-coil domain-containing protein 24 n=1 Tax=Batillaria attramentaria TaxID=370345 RepID=A0ABD0K8Q3_9CAEN
MATFPIDPGAYTPPLSLWQLVEQHVSPSEQEEIKSMLGASLVDQTLELRNEINLLLEIWQDYREETESENKTTPRLAEPPHVRDRLIQEICFLADSVKEKSRTKGMDLPAVLSRHSSQVLDYAEEVRRSGSSLGSARPLTARSPDGHQTPLSPTSQADSRRCLSAAISEDVSSADSKLNYLDFSEVCSRLRSTLEKEMEQLESDIAFLQSCLDDEANVRSGGVTPSLSREPTITELRKERSLLEKELLSAETIPSTPPVSKPAFATGGTTANIKMQNLGPDALRRRPIQTPGSAGSARAMPLKAHHSLTLTSPSADSFASTADSSSSIHSSSSEFDILDRLEAMNISANNTSAPGITQNPDLADVYKVTGDSPPTTQASHVAPSISPSSSTNSASYKSPSSAASSPPSRYQSCSESEEGARRQRSGAGARRRTVSPGRVRVVPVGSITDPRFGAGDGGHFIPSPPPGDKPQLPRPSSADRFRKFVLQCRDGT